MRVVLQRVNKARVLVDDHEEGAIGKGLVLLIGIARGDVESDVIYLMEKCANLRVFEDQDGKMNRSLIDEGGEILSVSQFTLSGDTRKGRRPGFDQAAPPGEAEPLYDFAVRHLEKIGIRVSTGIFGAHMKVTLENDGPVTLIMESK